MDGEPDPTASARIARILPDIDKMPFKFGQRYGGDPDADRWPCLWVDRPANPSRMELSWLSDRDLPQTEEAGKVAPLSLRDGQHLHYPTHMVLFDNGILGYEYWRPGPGPWVLASYVNERGCEGKISFEFLYKPDTLTDLRKLKEFRTLQIKIPVARAAALKVRDETLGSAMKVLQEIGKDVVVEIRIAPESKRGPLEGLGKIIKRLAKAPKEDGMQKLEVSGYDEETGERVVVDLLSARLVQRREMVLLGRANKAVEPGSAYRAIEHSYEQQKEAILDAAGYEPR